MKKSVIIISSSISLLLVVIGFSFLYFGKFTGTEFIAFFGFVMFVLLCFVKVGPIAELHMGEGKLKVIAEKVEKTKEEIYAKETDLKKIIEVTVSFLSFSMSRIGRMFDMEYKLREERGLRDELDGFLKNLGVDFAQRNSILYQLDHSILFDFREIISHKLMNSTNPDDRNAQLQKICKSIRGNFSEQISSEKIQELLPVNLTDDVKNIFNEMKKYENSLKNETNKNGN